MYIFQECHELAQEDFRFGIFCGIIMGFGIGVIFMVWLSTKVSFLGKESEHE